MLPYFILGFALLLGFLMAARWFATAETETLLKMGKRLVLVGVVALVVLLVVTGRLSWALMVLPALIPWLLRLRSLARAARNYSRMAESGGSRPGDQSQVATRFLRVTLDHASGAIRGEIIAGPYAGRNLEDLRLDELVALMQDCWAEDTQSAQVLEAYLDRVHPGWRETVAAAGGRRGETGAGFKPGAMTREEAYQILGVEPGAGPEAVKEAHRRLMAGLHPDHGGSSYLAAKLNQARDALLGKRR